MDRKTVLRLANDAGITFVTEQGVASATAEWLERFASAVAAAVKEEDAKICEKIHKRAPYPECVSAFDCASAIRASIKEGK